MNWNSQSRQVSEGLGTSRGVLHRIRQYWELPNAPGVGGPGLYLAPPDGLTPIRRSQPVGAALSSQQRQKRFQRSKTSSELRLTRSEAHGVCGDWPRILGKGWAVGLCWATKDCSCPEDPAVLSTTGVGPCTDWPKGKQPTARQVRAIQGKAQHLGFSNRAKAKENP